MNHSRNRLILWMAVFCFMFTLALAPALAMAQAAARATQPPPIQRRNPRRKPRRKKQLRQNAAADKAAAVMLDTTKKSRRRARKHAPRQEHCKECDYDTDNPKNRAKKGSGRSRRAAASAVQPRLPAGERRGTGSKCRLRLARSGGQTWLPPAGRASDAQSGTKTSATAAASSPDIAAAQPSGKVWVNTESGVYHKSGRWYGKTKKGKFMTEAEAKAAGYKEAQKE